MEERVAVGFNPRTLGDGLVYGANGDVHSFAREPKSVSQHKAHERNVHAKGGGGDPSMAANGSGQEPSTGPGATEGEKKGPTNEALLDKFRTDGTIQPSASRGRRFHLCFTATSLALL
jgi:hypothetical protein